MSELAAVRPIALRAFRGNGTLVTIEGGADLPFDVARLFYIDGVTAGSTRGAHAHIRCQQIFVCLRGRCEIACDDGRERRTFPLDSPDQALYVPAALWVAQHFPVADTLLMVLTDRHYEPEDYIRDYDAFLASRGAGR